MRAIFSKSIVTSDLIFGKYSRNDFSDPLRSKKYQKSEQYSANSKACSWGGAHVLKGENDFTDSISKKTNLQDGISAKNSHGSD